VHVLFGENGAGKSTLIQLVAGVYRQSSGSIKLKGNEVSLSSVQRARDLGVSAVFQEFSLVPELSVEDNLFLGSELTRGPFLNKVLLRKQARETLDRLGFPLKANSIVLYLSRAEQQMVEIAKAFRTKPSIMIFDEPTASLTEKETERLFQLIEQLKTQGIGIIYITHRMNEIKRIGDRITVLRDGRVIDTIPVEEASDQKLVELMTGRVIEQIFPEIEEQAGEELL
jgi:ribose transport system ATP-binding protein